MNSNRSHIAPDASINDIRRAYYELAMRWHPDRAEPDATFIFQQLSAAYRCSAIRSPGPPTIARTQPVPDPPNHIRRRAARPVD